VADPKPGSPAASADHHWWVECADPFGRARAMNVLVRQGEVVMVAPPGESAVLSARQTRLLGHALAYAAARARH
jgi:hypothetical protein